MPVVISGCCDGTGKNCRRWECRKYKKARREVDASWPRMPTGFGNAYGEPGESHYLARVSRKTKQVKKEENAPTGGHPFNHWR